MSPYSRYGLSNVDDVGFSQNIGMGGVGIALRSPLFINPLNPASYSSRDSMSFIFDAGMVGQYDMLRDSHNKQKNYRANFQYLAFSFPFAKNWGHTFGIKPYSFVGYNYAEKESLEGVGEYITSYQGEGSLNQLFWGQGYSPFKNFSLGLSMSYLFGNLYHDRFIIFKDKYTQKASNTRELSVSNFIYEFGMQYAYQLNKKSRLTLGAVFAPSIAINADYSEVVIAADTVQKKRKQDISLPSRLGFGISYNNTYRWLVSADYSIEKWESDLFIKRQNPLGDKSKFILGAEFLDNPYSKRFFKRLRYRMGFKYINSNIIINNEQIDEYGMTFGVGIPVGNRRSSINFACELGRRGTLDYDLVREDYIKIHVNFAFHDLWFHKRKFD